MHVRNIGSQERLSTKGQKMGIVGEVVLKAVEKPTPVLPMRFRKQVEKHINLAQYEHASDVQDRNWQGRNVLINDLDVGDKAEHEKLSLQAELSGARSVIMLQCIVNGEEVLQPWKEQGYKVEKIPAQTSQGKSNKKRRR